MKLFWETLDGYPIVTGWLPKVRVLKLVLIISVSYLYCVCISYPYQAMVMINKSIFLTISSNDDNQCVYISYPYPSMMIIIVFFSHIHIK